MRVSVIGGGAIGLLISYFLKKNHHDPVLYTRTTEQAEMLNQSGITYIDKFGNNETVYIDAKCVKEFNGIEKYCIITVTQNAIKDLGFLNEEIFKGISFLFLQNGIGHMTWLESLPSDKISVGVVEHGAMREDMSTVKHVGIGKIKISSYKGDGFVDWANILSYSEFPIELKSDWESMLYKKLIMNASINPITAILRIPNGELLKNQHAQELMKQLFEEAVTVLALNEMKDELWKELLDLCRNTSLNRSSMLKSVESGKQTEIDAITGEIIKRAEMNRVPAPYSMFAYHAVKGWEWRG
jgi:2-dehydropantoate 2-reductase